LKQMADPVVAAVKTLGVDFIELAHARLKDWPSVFQSVDDSHGQAVGVADVARTLTTPARVLRKSSRAASVKNTLPARCPDWSDDRSHRKVVT
jgi:hypothetical protein